jgi:uncharacterized protein with PQ loop repeat
MEKKILPYIRIKFTMQTEPGSSLVASKYSRPSAFLVALLLFLLPFVNVRCNGEKFASNSGIGLAIGSGYKMSGELNSMRDSFNGMNPDSKSSEKEEGKQYMLALLALLLGIGGVIYSLADISSERSMTATTIIGTLAAIALIALMVQMNMDIKEESKKNSSLSEPVMVTIQFTIWYYLSILSFLAAAFFSYQRKKFLGAHDLPPKHAPQIPITNPGDQSEFPRSPEEPEVK